MVDQNLIDALEDCIARLADGETVAACLARYPNFAADLHPMLESGLLIGRMAYPPAVVDDARNRIQRRLDGLMGGPSLWRTLGLLLVALLAGVLLGTLATRVASPQPVATALPLVIARHPPNAPPATGPPAPHPPPPPPIGRNHGGLDKNRSTLQKGGNHLFVGFCQGLFACLSQGPAHAVGLLHDGALSDGSEDFYVMQNLL